MINLSPGRESDRGTGSEPGQLRAPGSWLSSLPLSTAQAQFSLQIARGKPKLRQDLLFFHHKRNKAKAASPLASRSSNLIQKKEEVESSGTAGYKRGHRGAQSISTVLVGLLSASSSLSPIISAATNNRSEINRLVTLGFADLVSRNLQKRMLGITTPSCPRVTDV